MNVSGTVGHVHWTPDKFAHLTDEELEMRLALIPRREATGINQDAPQIKPGLKPAIEAEMVEPEAISG